LDNFAADASVSSASVVFSVVDANTELLQIKGTVTKFSPSGLNFDPHITGIVGGTAEIDVYFNAAGLVLANDTRNKLIVQGSYGSPIAPHTFFESEGSSSGAVLAMASVPVLDQMTNLPAGAEFQFLFSDNIGEYYPGSTIKADFTWSKPLVTGAGHTMTVLPYFTQTGEIQDGVIWRDKQVLQNGSLASQGKGNIWAPLPVSSLGGLMLLGLMACGVAARRWGLA
jgi:hypothetical protein